MKKEKKYIVFMMLLALSVILCISNSIYASNPIDNPDGYDPRGAAGAAGGDAEIVQITSRILTVLSDIGVVVSVISIAVIGVKYISTENRV